MLFQPSAIDSQESAVIDRIEDLQKNLRYAVQTPARWYGLLRRMCFARAIRGSNSIEGYNVSVEDAIAAAEGEEPFDAKEADWAAVVGYRQAMTYVLQLADDPHFVYSADLLRGLHFMMISHDLSKNPGKWRPGPISVVDSERGEVVYEGPDASLAPVLVDELMRQLNALPSGTPVLVRAAMGHLNLAMIHPFSDGNGRMARCLQTLILAREGVLAPQFASIEEHLGRNTREYYDVLAEVGGGRWNPDRDTRRWIRFCLTAHYRQAMTVLRRSREMHRLWDALEMEIRRRKLPERMILALADAAFGLRVRNATYRTAAEVSIQVASKDLKVLVDQGFLVAGGEKRGRYYRASELVRGIMNRVQESKKVADPFEEDVSAGGV